MERRMSCDGFDESKRLQQQHPTHGHGSSTAIPSHPPQAHLLLTAAPCMDMVWDWAVQPPWPPLRASPPTPPPPGTTTNTHPGSLVSLPFKLGRRPNPPSVLFLSSFFLSPILVSVPTPDFHPPGPSWLPVAVSLHDLVVLGASSHLGIVACLLLAAIGFPGGYLRRPFPFLS